MSKAQLSDYKEVFQLFDKNEDGVLSFSELGQAMKTLGHRIKGVGGGVLDFNIILSSQEINCLIW